VTGLVGIHRRSRLRGRLICGGLALVLLLSIAVCLSLGPIDIPVSSILRILLAKVGLLGGPERIPDSFAPIILHVRLPRVLLACLVGSALAVSGGAMQAMFRNPMASPYVVGVSAGASFGAALSIVLGLPTYALPLISFLLALATAFAVYYVARSGGRVPGASLLLSGIAVSLFLSAMLSLTEYVAGEQELREIVFWLMGGLWKSTWESVALAVLPIAIGTGALLLFARDLDALLIGEEAALDLGVDVESVRRSVLALATLATAGAVCMVGIIGFVGLMIPHLLRLLVGPGHRLLLPASMITGAIFLVWADLLARSVIAPAELPVGIITGLVGAPFFLWLLRRRRGAAGW